MENYPSNRQPLTFATRKSESPLAHNRIVALRHLHNSFVYEGCFGRLNHIVPASLRPRIKKVPLHSVMEQITILSDKSYYSCKICLFYLANVAAVNGHRAFGNVIQPRHQISKCGLTCPTRANKSGQLTWRYMKTDSVQSPKPRIFK